MTYILSTVFGFMGIITNMIIFWQKDRQRLLFVKLLADIVWTVHYSLLFAWTGAVTCGISIIRETVFLNKKHKWAESNLWSLLFVTINIVFAAYMWKNILNILPACAGILSVVSFSIAKPKLTRALQIVISLMFIMYDIYVMSYAGIVNEFCTLSSVAMALIYYKHKS